MSNEFLEAARNSDKEDSSSERYKKAKKQKADTDRSMAEKRYDELKEKAKQEFIEKQRKRETEQEEQEEDDTDDSGGNFITY